MRHPVLVGSLTLLVGACVGAEDGRDWAWVEDASLSMDEGLVEAREEDDPWGLYRGSQGLQHVFVDLVIDGCATMDPVEPLMSFERRTLEGELLDEVQHHLPFQQNDGQCQRAALQFPFRRVEDLNEPVILVGRVAFGGASL